MPSEGSDSKELNAPGTPASARPALWIQAPSTPGLAEEPHTALSRLPASDIMVLGKCPFSLKPVGHCMLNHFSSIQVFVTLQTVSRQALLSMGFSRQESWSGLHALFQGVFPTWRSIQLCFIPSLSEQLPHRTFRLPAMTQGGSEGGDDVLTQNRPQWATGVVVVPCALLPPSGSCQPQDGPPWSNTSGLLYLKPPQTTWRVPANSRTCRRTNPRHTAPT